MSSEIHRRIFIDDNDELIHYNGPWTLVEKNSGLFGTVHELFEPTGVASLSVEFTGTLISATAFTSLGNDSSGTLVAHPVLYTISCIIDGSSASLPSLSEVSSDLTNFCQPTEPLLEGTHTLEIVLTFLSPGPNFVFDLDYLLVTPAQNQVIGGQENLLFFWDDPVIQASIQQANAGWANQDGWSEAFAEGAQFTLHFTGVSIMWFGKKSTNSLSLDSTATYTVDGRDSSSFSLFYSTQLPDLPNLFNTQEYPYGNHTLHVVYNGDVAAVPLSLSSLIIQRTPSGNAANVPQVSITTTAQTTITSISTTASSATSTTIPPASESFVQTNQHGHNAARIGGIAAGIIVFVLIIVAVVVFFLARRRSRTGGRTMSDNLMSSDQLYNNAQSLATGSSHVTPSSYDIQTTELHRAPQSAMLSPESASNIHTSQAQIGLYNGMGWTDGQQVYHNVHGDSAKMRIV